MLGCGQLLLFDGFITVQRWALTGQILLLGKRKVCPPNKNEQCPKRGRKTHFKGEDNTKVKSDNDKLLKAIGKEATGVRYRNKALRRAC